MADGSRDEHTIDDLIAALERAPDGSSELDRMVAFQLGLPIGESDQMIKLLLFEGYSWDVISELVKCENPCFSTALDARIPGENIVLAMQSTKRSGQWAAIHRSAGGTDFMAWAATEPLARRAAALRGLRAVSSFEMRAAGAGPEAAGLSSRSTLDELTDARAADDDDASAAPESNPSATDANVFDAEVPSGGEWKILF